ncbi:MAG TPA: type II secretion system protein GspM [Gemmatimonadales bacterium]|jgi:type II secretory pathway component PulM|nr:type II secretion system protein GspM [Gemmatimonadales bacterium]
MKAFRWLSDSFRRLSRREQRVLLGGGAVATTALLVVFALLPLRDRWSSRESTYAASRDRYIRLQTLVASESRLRGALEAQQQALRASVGLLATGSTPALAGSNLQALVQRYAEESVVQLDRIFVAGEAKADSLGLVSIPVQLQGQGDIYGLVDFLFRLQHGEKLLVIDDLTITAGIPQGGRQDFIVWSMTMHGLYASAGKAS